MSVLSGQMKKYNLFWRVTIVYGLRPSGRRKRDEIRSELDMEQTALMFHHIFGGMSFEDAFFKGLDTKKLHQELNLLYSLVKI